MIWQGPVAIPPPPPPPPGVDVNFLINQLVPLVGVVVGLIVAGVVLYAFLKSDIVAAIAERIRAGMHRRKGIDTAGDEPRGAQLEGRLGLMPGPISWAGVWLDFAGRVPAQERESRIGG